MDNYRVELLIHTHIMLNISDELYTNNLKRFIIILLDEISLLNFENYGLENDSLVLIQSSDRALKKD